MQVRVPQNIDQDDKIIGSLTLGQLIYAFIGGIILVLLVVIGLPFAVFVTLALPVVLVTLSLTVATINGRPLARIAIDFVLWFLGPRQRLWQDPANAAVKSSSIAPSRPAVAVPSFATTVPSQVGVTPKPAAPISKRDWLSNPSQNWLAQGEQSQQAISQEVDQLASLGQLGPDPIESTANQGRRVILGKNKLEVTAGASTSTVSSASTAISTNTANPTIPSVQSPTPTATAPSRILKVQRAS
ncbi:MAG: hypothetical protein CEO22_681 [Candidatus Berkelbacteria bacterium Gr01-1014_85]|uniref:PrgI family protein n=1 Tax=Candidatus Berkelbacteria bacterium Gr01-1014_85 TaxID=2017150 RepID=A0A554J901_9BACT|nr:MAG: hypothetical protein CEO22_681 [Candidatus Berkelbacteria bacterium Gr01-1014_85]